MNRDALNARHPSIIDKNGMVGSLVKHSPLGSSCEHFPMPTQRSPQSWQLLQALPRCFDPQYDYNIIHNIIRTSSLCLCHGHSLDFATSKFITFGCSAMGFAHQMFVLWSDDCGNYWCGRWDAVWFGCKISGAGLVTNFGLGLVFSVVTNFGLELVFPWSQILVWDFWFGIFFGDVTAVVTNFAVRFSYVRIRRDMWQGGAVSGKWALISSRLASVRRVTPRRSAELIVHFSL